MNSIFFLIKVSSRATLRLYESLYSLYHRTFGWKRDFHFFSLIYFTLFVFISQYLIHYGFLSPGSEAVLGPPQAVCHQRTPEGVPLEQAVSRQRLRPGSGFLSGCVTTDGPTIVLQISDIHEKVTIRVKVQCSCILIYLIFSEFSKRK